MILNFFKGKKNRLKAFRDYHKTTHHFYPTEDLQSIPRQFSSAKTKIDLHLWRQRIIKIILLIIFFYLLYFFIYSPYWQINQVKISGGNENDNTLIKNFVNDYLNSYQFFILPRRNILLLSKKSLEEIINKKILVSQLNVDKDFPHQLNLEIKEGIYTFILTYEGRYYLMNQKGQIAKEIFSIEDLKELPEINIDNPDEQKIEININQQFLFEEQIKTLIDVNNLINQETLIKIASFYYNQQKPTEFYLITSEGWKIYFLFASDMKVKILNLRELIKQKIDNTKNLKYIDLRTERWIYYQ